MIRMKAPSAAKLRALFVCGGGRSEGRIVERKVSIRIDEVVSGTLVVVAVDLIAVAGFEGGEDLVKEVEDFDDGLVGQRGQRWFARRSLCLARRRATLARCGLQGHEAACSVANA